MKRTLMMSSVAWLLAACAPDLDANGAARCDQRTPCAQGASCYRGLCVPDAFDASSFEPDDGDPGQIRVDAGPGLASTGSAVESLLGDAGEVADADEGKIVEADEGQIADAGEGGVLDASAPRATEIEAAAAQPPTARDAGAPGAAPTPRPAPDAGGPAVNPPCTLEACCEEARKAYEANEKRDGRWNGKKGRCGCGDPDLFLVLGCGSSTRAPP